MYRFSDGNGLFKKMGINLQRCAQDPDLLWPGLAQASLPPRDLGLIQTSSGSELTLL
jgi:hypothetical protein